MIKITVEDTSLGVYEMEVPDDYFNRPKIPDVAPTVEARLAALEEKMTELEPLKSQLTDIQKTTTKE